MTTRVEVRAEESAWSYSTGVDVAASLSTYLKFLKSKPRLDEVFFYLQSTYLLDYGFSPISLYAIDSQSNIKCVESTGSDVLGDQGKSSLADIKKVIPAMQPTQSEPITDCLLSHDESLVFFPFSRHIAVDAFFLHHAPGGLKQEAKSTTALKFLALIQAMTAHHVVLADLLPHAGHFSTSTTQEVHLTERQKKILAGMVDAKTNHQLAHDLGFSVSTIRHETMEIYQLLHASDRKEAAEIALKLNLI
jgi:DNA-binding CsgD family transcriptional regulator